MSMYAGKKGDVEPMQLVGAKKFKLRPRGGKHKKEESDDDDESIDYDDMEDSVMPSGIGMVIIVIVILAILYFFLFRNNLATLGSGGTSGNIPNIPLYAPVIRDNQDFNIGHGLGYGTYEYDIFSKTGRQKENEDIDDWMREDIEKDHIFQNLQIPTIPGHPAGGGPWLLGKDFIGEFDKKINIPEIPGKISGDPDPNIVLPIKEDSNRDEWGIASTYSSVQDRLRNPNYIFSKITTNPVFIKNKTNSKQNKHIERMREEIKSSDKISGGEIVDIALKRDTSIAL